MALTPDERHQIVAQIQPRLLKIASNHETSWIVDFVGRQPQVNFSDALRLAGQIVERRERHEPLAYIFGSWSFRAHEFFVGPGVLIPRPETEELVEAALMSLENSLSTSHVALDQNLRVVDFGAGSGCLGLSLICDLLKDVQTETGRAAEISRKYHLTLIEKSPEALPFLKKNIEALRPQLLNAEVEIFAGSWADWPVQKSHLILSNPPYLTEQEYSEVEPSVQNYEPKSALVPDDVHAESEAWGPYKKILDIAASALHRGGWIWFEMGQTQPNWIQSYAKDLDAFNDLRMMKDMSRKYRFFCARRS